MNLYAQKFRAVYGTSRSTILDRRSPHRSQGETLVPMLWVTVVVAIGWTLVIQPEPLRISELWIKGTSAVAPTFNSGALMIAFVGAYFFVVQLIVRRYFQDDLKADAYVNALQRIVSVVLIVSVVTVVWPDGRSEKTLFAVAFFIGIFPQIGLDLIWEGIKRIGVASLRPSLRSSYPLSDLDGLNVFYESRLLEEGIEDMQNLATVDLVNLMLHTRIPLGRLVDWIDQCCLYLRLPPRPSESESESPARATLRLYGIRSALSLEDAWSRWNEQQRSVDLLGDQISHGPVRLETLVATFRSEPNLHHVRAWKRQCEGDSG